MKRIYSLFFTAVMMAACTGEMPEGYTVSQEALSTLSTVILYAESKTDPESNFVTSTLALATNTKWHIEKGDEAKWLSILPTEGNGPATLDIQAAKHNGAVDRSATFHICTTGGLRQQVKVAQMRAGASLYIYNPEAKSVGEEGGTFTLLVNCNTDWSVRTDAGWCRAVKSGKGSEGQEEVTVTVEAAPEGESRTCIVIFTCAGVETTVSVAQGTAGYYFAASPASTDVGRNGGEYTISVASNVLWTVVASHSWLHIDTMQGKGNGDIHVTAEPNPATSPRTATLTFTSTQQTGAYTQVCTFVQEPGRAADEWDNDTPEK